MKATGQVIPPSLPKIDELFDRLSEAEVISVLDISDAFPCCKVHPETRRYLQFTWNGARYQFVGMPFGILFMSSKFQNLMTEVLRPCHGFVIVFVDDIIIFSRNAEEHEAHVRAVLDELTRWNLRVKMAKAQLGYKYAYILGHQCGGGGIRPDRRKLLGMELWPRPTASTIEYYLGLFNYFRKFIPMYAKLAAPLEKVRKAFSWTELQEDAWQAMQRALLHSPMLHFPDWNKRFYLSLDASPEGISAVLFQMKDQRHDDIWRDGDVSHWSIHEQAVQVNIIAMQSRATKQHEREGYSQNKLETLALVFGLERMRYYLLGRVFTVFTDHKALVYMFSKVKTNRTLAGWMDIMMEYTFHVVHLPGVRNVLNDILSRIWPKNGGGNGEEPTIADTRKKPFKIHDMQLAFMPSSSQEDEDSANVKSVQFAKLYDLKPLDSLSWTTRYVGPVSMPKYGQDNRRARTPEVLLAALTDIFGEMYDPCPASYTVNGLESRWKLVNFVHPPYNGDAIDRWIEKAIQQALLHDCLSIMLLPEWKRKAWFIMLAKHAQMHFFRDPIRFEPYCKPAAYRSVIAIMNKTVAQQIQRYQSMKIYRLKLNERTGSAVVDDIEERQRLIHHYHDMGHFGSKSISDALLSEGFRWPNMIHDISQVVQACEACHKFIIRKEGFHPLTSITADMPMDQIAIDLFDMPTSEEGYIKGLIVVDICTRFAWIRALRTALAIDVARQLYKLFCQVGFPKVIQSDNGPEFRASLIKAL